MSHCYLVVLETDDTLAEPGGWVIRSEWVEVEAGAGRHVPGGGGGRARSVPALVQYRVRRILAPVGVDRPIWTGLPARIRQVEPATAEVGRNDGMAIGVETHCRVSELIEYANILNMTGPIEQ